jgi:hypothetical protein
MARRDAREDDQSLTQIEREQWARNRGGRFKSLRCGRRYGKTTLGEVWLGEGAAQGEPCGWFAPNYKYTDEVFEELREILDPIVVASSKTKHVIRTLKGGRIDFWTLEDERAGRSRFYKRVFIDEAAYGPPTTLRTWETSIKPTLLDLNGSCVVASNTKGVAEDNFLWQVCNNHKLGFIQLHAPSFSNPTIPRRRLGETDEAFMTRKLAIFAKLKQDEHPLVYRQEYEAEFVDWSGVAFFALDKMLLNGKPIDAPRKCDVVFAVVDSASKTGTENDGTAVTYYALSRSSPFPLTILDWDIVQIEGALLDTWLTGVFVRLQELSRECGARKGSAGVFIEDAASGIILLQQARKRELDAHAIDSQLTSLGKDERALNASGYVYRGNVKFCDHAYHKVSEFKGATRNHLISQVTGFRMGDKDNAKRADDLLDTYTYGIALSLGDKGGF